MDKIKNWSKEYETNGLQPWRCFPTPELNHAFQHATPGGA